MLIQRLNHEGARRMHKGARSLHFLKIGIWEPFGFQTNTVVGSNPVKIKDYRRVLIFKLSG